MKTFLHISDATFDSAVSFMRQLKADGCETAVFSFDLKKEANRKKIGELGFSLLDEINPYEHLSNLTEPSALVLGFKKPLPKISDGFIYCSGILDRSPYDLERLVSPINNIPNRVNVAKLLEANLVAKLGGILAADYVVASSDFWKLMNGVHKKWADEGYATTLHDLLFNFCIAFYDKASILRLDNA